MSEPEEAKGQYIKIYTTSELDLHVIGKSKPSEVPENGVLSI